MCIRRGEKFLQEALSAAIYSDREQVKRMSLGYSDEATVFLNGRPLFTRRSAYHYRDPGPD